MKPKLLRASVLGFLVGGLIMYAYFRYVDPVVEMKHLLQESNRDKERIIVLQDKLAAKGDSLDVFKLNHAAIQAYNRQTWNHFELSEEQQEKLLRGEPIIVRYRKYYEPDTLDSLEEE